MQEYKFENFMKNRDSYDFMKDMKKKKVMTEGNIVKILIMFGRRLITAAYSILLLMSITPGLYLCDFIF